MKKRVLSALLVLALACGLVSTAWAADGQAAPTAEPASQTVEVDPAEVATSENAAANPSGYPARTAETKVEGTDATVQVDIPAGSLPEDAALTASLIGSSTDDAAAVADVAAELDNANVDYDGFVALDISFKDAQGNEVEPLQPVAVSFSLPADLLPEEVDPETLAVQHLEEDAAGEVKNVVTVADTADAAEGTVTVEAPVATLSAAPAPEANETAALPENAEVTAEFTVDGFSTFTITWQGNGDWGEGVHEQIKVVCVDEETGKEIDVDNSETILSFVYDIPGQPNVTDVKSVAPVFYGYEFVRARVKGTNKEVGQIRLETWAGIINPTPQAYYDGEWHDIDDGDIEFVYRKKPETTTPGGTGEPQTLTHEKMVTDNGDGTYNLSLSVVGSVGSEENKANVDVVFVLDMSSSMNDPLQSGIGQGVFGQRKMRLAASAIESMVKNLTSNDNLDVQYSLAKFGSGTLEGIGWTKEPVELINQLEINVQEGEGTNYEAGLLEAEELLKTKRPGANTIVVFISDGEPTYYFDDSPDGLGGNGSDFSQDALNAAETVLRRIASQIDSFYTVGLGRNTDYEHLSDLSDTIAENVHTEDFTGSDTSSINQAFADIGSSIIYIPCTDVTITDTLSNYVDIVPSTSAKVEVTDANGEPQTVTGISADVSGDTITLNFPDTYTLQQDWTYKVTVTVAPNQAAYDLYNQEGGYPHTGDTGTGDSSANKVGIYSNAEDRAKLTYTVNGKKKTEDYPMPVVQLTPNTLTIEKTFVGLTEEQINDLTGLSFEVTLTNNAFTTDDGITQADGKRTQTVTFTTSGDNAFTKKEETDSTYVYSIPGISPNTVYSVKEVGGALDGYEVQVTPGDTASGTFSTVGNETKTASFTNTYTEKPKFADLTIDKDLSSNVTGNVTQPFTFTIEKTDGGITDGTKFGDVEFNDNKATVTIQGAGQKVIVNLPLGEYTVTENAPADIDLDVDDDKLDYYPTGTKHQVGTTSEEDGIAATVDLQGPTTVKFTNSYKPYKTLTVEKIVTGEMGSSSDYFDFSATKLGEDGSSQVDVTLVGAEAASDPTNNDFKLKSGGTVTIVNLKEGDEVTISEAADDNRGYTAQEPTLTGLSAGVEAERQSNISVKVTVPGGDGTDLGTVTFNNHREAVAPTGLESNHTTPYVLMITAAGMAGLALIGGMAARRVRRRRED